jgi:hypothetical protein
MRVALDVESVLAEPNEAVARSTDRLTLDEIENTWFSDLDESQSYQIYMGVSDAIWRHNPQIIPPEEPDLSTYVAEMHERVGQLDIVTHRQHVDEQVVWWLAEHEIVYDNFVSCDVPKQELDYDVYVDDNPNLFGECRLLLRHQPWNAHLDDSESKMCDRIHSLSEVVKFL